jgi:hypothetical protein
MSYDEEDNFYLNKLVGEYKNRKIIESKDESSDFLKQPNSFQPSEFDAMARAQKELDWIQNSVAGQSYQDQIDKTILSDVNLTTKFTSKKVGVAAASDNKNL